MQLVCVPCVFIYEKLGAFGKEKKTMSLLTEKFTKKNLSTTVE